MSQDQAGVSGRYLRVLFDGGVAAGLTDGQLLERFATQGGEVGELAFAVLVERHGPLVLDVSRNILRDEHDSMDAFQATFLVLVRKGESLWVRDSLGPWLHRVACRVAARFRAENRRRKDFERRAALMSDGRTNPTESDHLALVVHEELDRLPERYRAPIVLCDLEGCTCEQAARRLGCPVGTIGSRLARGRERLRGRLARRGLAPAVGALAASLSAEVRATTVSTALANATVRAVAGKPAVAIVAVAGAVSRSMILARCASVAAVLVAACGMSLAGSWAFRPTSGAQAPKAQAAPKPKRSPREERFPFMNEKDRHKDFIYAEIGNMRPLIHDAHGVRFQSREAIAYKDGTAKLWSFEKKDPIAELKHREPIRELTFFDHSGLLVTRSDQSIKIWDGLTGKPRKEIEKQTISPMWLSFAPSANRFVTIAVNSTAVTVWDTSTLEPVATLKPEKTIRRVAAGLSGDGAAVVTFTFGADEAIQIWDIAAGKSFATLKRPSSIVAEVFTDGGNDLNKPRLTPSVGVHEGRLWDTVRSLGPAGRERPK